jgi:hypothetical protein
VQGSLNVLAAGAAAFFTGFAGFFVAIMYSSSLLILGEALDFTRTKNSLNIQEAKPSFEKNCGINAVRD